MASYPATRGMSTDPRLAPTRPSEGSEPSPTSPTSPTPLAGIFGTAFRFGERRRDGKRYVKLGDDVDGPDGAEDEEWGGAGAGPSSAEVRPVPTRRIASADTVGPRERETQTVADWIRRPFKALEVKAKGKSTPNRRLAPSIFVSPAEVAVYAGMDRLEVPASGSHREGTPSGQSGPIPAPRRRNTHVMRYPTPVGGTLVAAAAVGSSVSSPQTSVTRRVGASSSSGGGQSGLGLPSSLSEVVVLGRDEETQMNATAGAIRVSDADSEDTLPGRSRVGSRTRSKSDTAGLRDVPPLHPASVPVGRPGGPLVQAFEDTPLLPTPSGKLETVEEGTVSEEDAGGPSGDPPRFKPGIPRSKSHQPRWTKDLRENMARRFSQLHDLILPSRPAATPFSTITHLDPPLASPQNPLPPLTPVPTPEFALLVRNVVRAIAQGEHPTLISRGSSGSYFAREPGGAIVAVYKPRDEEPYGALNPKWTKWLHRNLLPCFFGRSCLIPNLGYISEAAASYIDRKMGLNIVPRTEIVRLASSAFHYDAIDRRKQPLRAKTGSFQLFVHGFVDSGTFFREGYERAAAAAPNGDSFAGRYCGPSSATPSWPGSRQSSGYSLAPVEPTAEREEQPDTSRHPMGWSEQTQREFQAQFERLVVLDYLIRNTDRGQDNWLVRYDGEGDQDEDQGKEQAKPSPNPGLEVPSAGARISNSGESSRSGSVSPNGNGSQDCQPCSSHRSPRIRIAAIDNGLAFPHTHPTAWRSYPYGWAFLPIARVPFSQGTRDLVLPLLTSETWWRELFEGLEQLFRLDAGFDEGMWRKQRALMRGQGYSLVEILRRSEVMAASDPEAGSPWALVRRPNVMVYEEEVLVDVPADIPEGVVGFSVPPSPSHEQEAPMRRRIRTVRQRFEALSARPWFSGC